MPLKLMYITNNPEVAVRPQMWSDSTSFTGCPGKRMYSREESISVVFLTF